MIDPETSKAIQKQMLDKMTYYRELLKEALACMNGAGWLFSMDVKKRIKEELLLNPEFEVLEHLPHGKVMALDYTAINTGPEPK